MKLSRKEAYLILELAEDADRKAITTSYKKLAEENYPEGDDESAKLQRFKAISMAYSRLKYPDRVADDEIHMSVAEMLRLYDDMVELYLTDSDDDDYDDDDDDDDDDAEHWRHRFDRMQLRDIDGTGDYTYNKGLTAEQIEKNANELITEEEREKKKAEKRRAKKKRRREKKRQEKLAENTKVPENSQPAVNGKANHENSNGNPSSKKSKNKKKEKESEDEESFDPNAAFFTKVISKKKKGVIPESSGSSKNKSKQVGRTEEDSQELDQIVLRSRQLAIRGNEMANMGEYTAAIDLFSEAIKLDPNDFRFFGNRSYCFDGIEQYDKALRDANKAIDLSPDWPKGYFRKGRALAGLKQYADAEQAFMQVLKLDRNCEDANQELFRVRTHQLMEMGFTRIQAEAGLRQYGSVQQALDSLLSGLVADTTSVGNEVYISDDEEEVPAMPAKSNKTQVFTQHPVFTHLPITTATKGSDTKMDFTNPEGLTALWVGNVLPEVTDKKLQLMFSKFGTVTSVRCLPEKFCAFVNFKTKEAAGKAMQGLQGTECAGQRLLIKFPDNPITSNGQTLIKKPLTAAAPITNKVPQNFRPAVARTTTTSPIVPDLSLDDKLSGPVNGDECYFWRTTGCSFGKTCRYKHIPTQKGVDKKPWQKN